MSNSDKLKALQLTLDKLEKNYGKGTIMKLGDTAVEPIEAISTGSLGLDIALGIGGVPKGRIIEIYGPESSGKTTLATHIVAEAQKKVVSQQSLMRNTLLINIMPKSLGLISRTF